MDWWILEESYWTASHFSPGGKYTENMLLKIYINLLLLNIATGNPDAKRLYSNLLANYDRLGQRYSCPKSDQAPLQTHSARGQQLRQVDGPHEAEALPGHRSGEWLWSLVADDSRLCRTWGGRYWPPTCGWSKSGQTTSWPGTPRTMAVWSTSTCPVRTSGCQTSSSITSNTHTVTLSPCHFVTMSLWQ